jgi:hypothetical protein
VCRPAARTGPVPAQQADRANRSREPLGCYSSRPGPPVLFRASLGRCSRGRRPNGARPAIPARHCRPNHHRVLRRGTLGS